MVDFFQPGLVSRVLLTFATVGYGFITIKADFNKTHATNPAWTPHARFHVVWQILSYTGFGVLALALIWMPGPLASERFWLALLFSVIVYGAFFAALLAMPLYGGRTFDDNGYRPFAVRLGGQPRFWDVNVTSFSVLSCIAAAAAVLQFAAL